MKRSTMLCAALLMVSPMASYAQGTGNTPPYFPPPERFKGVDACWFDRVYAPALVSPNDGVVESGIAQSVNAKLALPGAEFAMIRKSLGNLAVFGRTPSIKYKAYLAGLVLDNPSMFASIEACHCNSTEELFTSLSERLQKVLLSYNDRKFVGAR